jgi:predicted anti-sigma-YlaC factor YlaD
MVREPSGRPARRRRMLLALCVVLASGSFSACSVKRMAINGLADTLASSGDVFASDEDPELVRDAVPFSLKTIETLLAEVPDHPGLLLSACSGFTQYAYAFVQADADMLDAAEYDEAEALRARALKLYLRARDYCLRRLDLKHRGIGARLVQDPTGAAAGLDDVSALYWTGASWGAAVSLGLDRPELVNALPAVRALMERALVLDEDYAKGAIHEAFITLDSLSEALGGSEERARRHFARAVELQQGLSPGPYVALALGVSVGRQDRAEFERLLRSALAIDPERDPSNRLAILITQRRARHLIDRVDDLFLADGSGSVPVFWSLRQP